MKTLILLLFCFSVEAQDMNVNIKHFYFEFEKHTFTNRSFYLPQNEILQHSFNMGLKINIADDIYSEQLISSKVSNSQFRYIGYESEIGYRTKWGVDIYFRHFSGHAFDHAFDQRFPQENAVGLRFNLIRN